MGMLSTFAGMERTNVDMVQVFNLELNWVFGPVHLVGEQPDPMAQTKKPWFQLDWTKDHDKY
jgi:hypothetical protein